MRHVRSVLILASFLIVACSHYAPVSKPQMERDRRGDLLIDITLRHDLGFTERYVATYTVNRQFGHLVSSGRREKHMILPLRKIDELHTLSITTLLTAKSDTGPTCYDCTSYLAVVRAGGTVHTFSGSITDDATPVLKTLRALGVSR